MTVRICSVKTRTFKGKNFTQTEMSSYPDPLHGARKNLYVMKSPQTTMLKYWMHSHESASNWAIQILCACMPTSDQILSKYCHTSCESSKEMLMSSILKRNESVPKKLNIKSSRNQRHKHSILHKCRSSRKHCEKLLHGLNCPLAKVPKTGKLSCQSIPNEILCPVTNHV